MRHAHEIEGPKRTSRPLWHSHRIPARTRLATRTGSPIALPENMGSTIARKSVPLRSDSPTHRGDRLPVSAGRLRTIWHHHGLSIALLALFLVSMVGQTWAGWYAYNEEQRSHHQPSVTLAGYLTTGHFGEATFENWESEFLQMAFYVLLTAWLFQIGSSESKRPDVVELVDLDPRDSPTKERAPWPVRKGGIVLTLYENSLSIAFALLFLVSFALHARTGLEAFNQERMSHGETAIGLWDFAGSSQFWFESFQNWQSEFLSLAAMVGFTIVLRQRGSPESKPVDAPYFETGD